MNSAHPPISESHLNELIHTLRFPLSDSAVCATGIVHLCEQLRESDPAPELANAIIYFIFTYGTPEARQAVKKQLFTCRCNKMGHDSPTSTHYMTAFIMLSLALLDALAHHRSSLLAQIGSSRKARKRAAIVDMKSIDIPGLTPSAIMERIMGWVLDSTIEGYSLAVGLLLAVAGFIRYWEEFRTIFWTSQHNFILVAVEHLEAALHYSASGGDPCTSRFYLTVLATADFFVPTILEFPIEGGNLLEVYIPRLQAICPGLLFVLYTHNMPLAEAKSWLRIFFTNSSNHGPFTIERCATLMQLVWVNAYKCRHHMCGLVPSKPINVCTGCRVFRYCRKAVCYPFGYILLINSYFRSA